MACTVLVADDHASQRRMVELTFGPQGWTVLQAADGAEVLSLASLHRPDVILLDWQMPGLSGPEVCAQLRAEGFPGAILMVSGRSEAGDRDTALEAGADDLLVKPVLPTELLARVGALGFPSPEAA